MVSITCLLVRFLHWNGWALGDVNTKFLINFTVILQLLNVLSCEMHDFVMLVSSLILNFIIFIFFPIFFPILDCFQFWLFLKCSQWISGFYRVHQRVLTLNLSFVSASLLFCRENVIKGNIGEKCSNAETLWWSGALYIIWRRFVFIFSFKIFLKFW